MNIAWHQLRLIFEVILIVYKADTSSFKPEVLNKVSSIFPMSTEYILPPKLQEPTLKSAGEARSHTSVL